MGKRPNVLPSILPSLAKLIQSCWDQDPGKRPMFASIIANDAGIFNSAIREAIADGENLASKFWEKFGTNKDGRTVEDVEWDKFKREFLILMNTSENAREKEIAAVKALLSAEGISPKVTLSNFQHFARWFKPLRPCGGADLSTLDEVKQLVSAPWFWGEMDSNKAADVLSQAKRGSYLVRFSAKSEGQFTISYVIKTPKGTNTVTHTRLSLPLNQSVSQVVKSFCKTNKLKSPHLGRPSKFAVLFDITEKSVQSNPTINYVATNIDVGVSLNVDNFAWGDSSVVQ